MQSCKCKRAFKSVHLAYFSRITFIYGLLYQHGNLTDLTHSTLHEFFGHVTSLVSAQLALTMRRKKVVSASGEDIYLPDSNQGLNSPVYKEHINRLNMPIRFIVGKSTMILCSTVLLCIEIAHMNANKLVRYGLDA